jgi:hypothetical protein
MRDRYLCVKREGEDERGKEGGRRVYACVYARGKVERGRSQRKIIGENVVEWNEARDNHFLENRHSIRPVSSASPALRSRPLGVTVMPHLRLPFHIPSPAKWSPFKKHY